MTRAVVIGLAETGSAVTRRLRAEGVEVLILEDAPPGGERYRERVEEARAAGATLVEQPSERATLDAVDSADLVVPSPLVRVEHPALAAARARGVPVVAVAGSVGAGFEGMRDAGIERIETLASTPAERDAAMRDPLPRIEAAAARAVRAYAAASR